MVLELLLNIHGKIDWRDQVSHAVVPNIFTDSRLMEKNGVFVAVRGTDHDGHRYLADVADKASAVVVEDVGAVPDFFRGAVVEVLDCRLALQALTQRFYNHPGNQMMSVAVTGTNGKTSFSYIFEHLMDKIGFPCGVIGTIDHHLEDQIWPTELTTPDPITLQTRLHNFLQSGAQSFVIEASSHALKQNRLSQGIDVCVFTNLSRDHLDYHDDEEDYFRSKAKLFSRDFIKDDGAALAVVNGDDHAGQRLSIIGERECLMYGSSKGCDFLFSDVVQSLSGTRFKLQVDGKKGFDIESPLVGLHNVYNSVAAIAAIYALNLNWEKAIEHLSSFRGIPGRLQSVPNDKGVFAFVDYAHTDEGLRNVLTHLRTVVPVGDNPGRLICVFGCGGDRDKGKRKFMGRVACDLSDYVVVTSDNPRTEDPDQIIQDIVEELDDYRDIISIEPDRRLAIEKAVMIVRSGDILLVAGKGHETYQIIGDQSYPFDDYRVLLEEISHG